MKYGYARVSTQDQSLELQLNALRDAGCEDIRSEKFSGKSITGRDEFQKLVAEVKRGDEIWVTRLDRFARSLTDMELTIRALEARGVVVRAIHQPIDGGNCMGVAFRQIMGVFAELERSMIAERRAEGVAKAKADDAKAKAEGRLADVKFKGRKPKVALLADKMAAMRGAGRTLPDIALALGVGERSVSRALRVHSGA